MVRESLIVLFDSDCAFCSAFVKLIISHDSKNIFRFASLHSSTGKEIAKRNGFSLEGVNSVILIEDGKVYTHSTAVLRIFRHLKGLYWKALYALIVIPKTIRDFFYKIIAKNRYRFFKNRSCALPIDQVKERFLS